MPLYLDFSVYGKYFEAPCSPVLVERSRCETVSQCHSEAIAEES
jgi:hypothetical protein